MPYTEKGQHGRKAILRVRGVISASCIFHLRGLWDIQMLSALLSKLVQKSAIFSFKDLVSWFLSNPIFHPFFLCTVPVAVLPARCCLWPWRFLLLECSSPCYPTNELSHPLRALLTWPPSQWGIPSQPYLKLQPPGPKTSWQFLIFNVLCSTSHFPHATHFTYFSSCPYSSQEVPWELECMFVCFSLLGIHSAWKLENWMVYQISFQRCHWWFWQDPFCGSSRNNSFVLKWWQQKI